MHPHHLTPLFYFLFFCYKSVLCVSEVRENLSFLFFVVLVIKQQAKVPLCPKTYLLQKPFYFFQLNPKINSMTTTRSCIIRSRFAYRFLHSLRKMNQQDKTNSRRVNMLLMHPRHLFSGQRELGVGPCFQRSVTDLSC